MRSKLCIVSFCLLLGAALGADDERELKTIDGVPTASHGTSISFVENPVAAAKLAAKQKKLVLVLHVSGYFEDPDCT
jgi:hypothetical protein